MKPEHFNIREPKASDYNFIHSTICRAMHKESTLGKTLPTSKFFAEFTPVVDHILNTSLIKIACAKDDPDTILGYIIHTSGFVHFIFVKLAFRRLYIARDLVLHAFPDGKGFEYSLQTTASKRISPHFPNINYNPFILMKKGA